ncbi:MAG: hypothetical protein LBS33_01930 [Streptococcaceae bacterium]|jgi:hypothetical protein|nr:hypothetical protein [Streptococcaceae bacterium]
MLKKKKGIIVAVVAVIVVLAACFYLIKQQGANDFGWLEGKWQTEEDITTHDQFTLSNAKGKTISLKRAGEKQVNLTLNQQEGKETFIFTNKNGTKYKFVKVAANKLLFTLSARKGLIGLTRAIPYEKVVNN